MPPCLYPNDGYGLARMEMEDVLCRSADHIDSRVGMIRASATSNPTALRLHQSTRRHFYGWAPCSVGGRP